MLRLSSLVTGNLSRVSVLQNKLISVGGMKEEEKNFGKVQPPERLNQEHGGGKSNHTHLPRPLCCDRQPGIDSKMKYGNHYIPSLVNV
jgi:hypothetical protein